MALHSNPSQHHKLMGRWSSETFMDYTCPQIAKFSSMLSTAMIYHETFFNIPDNRNIDKLPQKFNSIMAFIFHSYNLAPLCFATRGFDLHILLAVVSSGHYSLSSFGQRDSGEV